MGAKNRSVPLCDLPSPRAISKDGRALLEAHVIAAAKRASSHFATQVMSSMQYRSTGVFFSEALALVAAVELVGATHLIESGTAKGQSTEILARHFNYTGRGLKITTIDRDTLYHLYTQTKERLAAWPSVTAIRGDSFVEVPRLLNGLPPEARVVVFVDGPKGELGLKLATAAMLHPQAALVALHDTARVWNADLYERLMTHPETILMTSDGAFRAAFGELDTQHDEERVKRETYAEKKWPASRIPQLVARGNGLWLAGKSKLLAGSPLFESSVHVAMASNRDSLPGLVTSIGSLLTSTFAPTAITIHLLMPWTERDAPFSVKQALNCLHRSGVASHARLLRLLTHWINKSQYRLLRGKSEGAVANQSCALLFTGRAARDS